MPREIKFRVWDQVNRHMVTDENWRGYRVDIGLNSFGVSRQKKPGGNFLCCAEGDCILMQYTGLKDRNGKEIYEGDIYEYLGFEAANGKQIRPRRRRIVASDEWVDACYRLRNIIEGSGSVDVIDNIHENPGLLEVEGIGG